MNIRIGLIALMTLIMGSTVADAHFLFVRLLPPAEGGRFAEVYFSDEADAGDPRFIDKIAHTKLWQQVKPGVFEALRVQKNVDRLRAFAPVNGATSVIGECTYGVLGRPKRTAFLLRHYPKAVEGRAEEIAALKPKREIPFEIVMRPVDGQLEFTALRHGKPIPQATFFTVGLDLTGHKFTANEQGQALWKPTGPGYFAVYTNQTLKEAGMHDGVKYDEIREFTTIAFPWPLHAEGADAGAVLVFQDAFNNRASWTKFPGFSADVQANVHGRKWKGTLTLSATGDVDIDMDDEVVTPWVKEQLESMAMHRVARPAGKPPVLRFGDHERDHPLGKLLVFEGGQFASSYRVKDGQIMVVNRMMGKTNMTITVLENDWNADKKVLPRSYTVQYWNAKTGELQRSENVQNRWVRVRDWDLPTHLSVITASSAGQGVKTMTLSNHRLNGGKKSD